MTGVQATFSCGIQEAQFSWLLLDEEKAILQCPNIRVEQLCVCASVISMVSVFPFLLLK